MDHDLRMLTQRSGNRCAICKRLLTADSSPPDREVILGDVAHIVAYEPDGPRGDSPLSPRERNKYNNLILLCNTHNRLVDNQPQTYTVEKLHSIKEAHEAWVEESLGKRLPYERPRQDYKTDTIYSTLLPVQELPAYVYGVPCDLRTDAEVTATMSPLREARSSLFSQLEMAPFVLRGGYLYAFQDLNERGNPFEPLVPGQSAERYPVDEWWGDPDYMRWYVDLLNRTLNKLTGRRHLHLDKEHRRYYFPMVEPGQEVVIDYRPLNQDRTRRKVVWEPKSRKTGQGRGKWYHRAVSLRFTQLDSVNWCLGIRPELRITRDGYQPIEAERIGSHVTRRKSRMFNYDLLGEVHFWRDYLSDSRPRIIMPFGDKQRVIVSSTLMSGAVTWPGIPPEHDKPFTNIEYADDLFSWAEVANLDVEHEEQEWQLEGDDEDGDDDI